MIFADPSPTRWDLRFSLFGFPVRVHPMFWLTTAFLSWNPNVEIQPVVLLIWILAVFISVLVHEMGHALTFALYGVRSEVVLYSFGGLAVPRSGLRGVWRRILVLLAGPGAGFLLALLLVTLIGATGHRVGVMLYWQPFWFTGIEDPNLNLLLLDLLWINCIWGLFNLLPIYPLDGGQISRNLFLHFASRDALRKSLWVSIGTAVALGLYILKESEGQRIYTPLMLGYLAYLNYRELETAGSNRW